MIAPTIIHAGLQPLPGIHIFKEAKRIMFSIGEDLLEESRVFLQTLGPEKTTSLDLLSVILKANLNESLPKSQRLTDEDVLCCA